jgi:hypothetical protein
VRKVAPQILALFVAACVARSAEAAPCSSTGFIRDGIDLTAAVIVTGQDVLISQTIDATGCNIGVYFAPGSSGTVDASDISGANYFGVVMDGGTASTTMVDLTDNQIHHIGEQPFNGSQHGVAIYAAAFTATSSVSGNITGNKVHQYQKGGIVTNGEGTNFLIRDNEVSGLGPVGFIAQNGIQIGYGSRSSAIANKVLDNRYTGSSTVSGGIIVVGGPAYGLPYTVGTQIMKNVVSNNDVGVFLSNLAADGSAPASQTNIKVVNNTIESIGLSNGYPYQAGVSDVGNNDKIINNTIGGAGYDPATLPGATFKVDADPSFTNRAKVHATK